MSPACQMQFKAVGRVERKEGSKCTIHVIPVLFLVGVSFRELMGESLLDHTQHQKPNPWFLHLIIQP